MLNQSNPEKKVEVIAETLPPDSLHREADKGCIKRWIEVRKKGVLAINGRWGSGKTWLSDSLLEDFHGQESYIGVKIDAFSADWSDEPELTIFSEIFASKGFEAIQKHEDIRRDIRKGLIMYSGMAAKIGIRALTYKLVGQDFDFNNLVESPDLDALVNENLKSAENKKAGLDAIHEAIQGLYSSGKKIVILVDELDRCSPPYAVKLLEKIKHLFDVDGVIVILVWNEEQMRDSLSHFYGKTNANYFQKFVHATHNLFPKSQLNGSKAEIAQVLIRYFEEYYRSETSDSKKLEYSLDLIIAISNILDLNARESHRFLDLVACWDGRRINAFGNRPAFLGWLLAALLVKNKALVESLRDGKAGAKNELLEGLKKITSDDFRNSIWVESNICSLIELLGLKQDEGFPRDKQPPRREDWPFYVSELQSDTITGESFGVALQRTAATLFVV